MKKNLREALASAILKALSSGVSLIQYCIRGEELNTEIWNKKTYLREALASAILKALSSGVSLIQYCIKGEELNTETWNKKPYMREALASAILGAGVRRFFISILYKGWRVKHRDIKQENILERDFSQCHSEGAGVRRFFPSTLSGLKS